MAAYCGGLTAIILGGAYGSHALLSNAPIPSFLVPEYLSKYEAPAWPVEQTAMVQIKPYAPPPPSLAVGWKPSLAQGFRTKALAAGDATRAKQDKLHVATSKPAKRKPRKHHREAMDAYASSL